MKKFEIIPMAAAILLATSVTSCNKEEVPSSTDSKSITLTVNAKDAVETKSSSGVQRSETVEISGDGESLFITSTRSINGDSPFEDVSTKGAEKTADSVKAGFTMSMISDATNSLYMSGTVEQRGDTKIYPYWSFYYGKGNDDKINWPEDAESGATYSFLACISAANVSLSGFDYAKRSVTYKGMDHKSGSVEDAILSEDLLVAYTASVKHDHKAQNLVNLNFYHPLAAVKFHVTEKVKKITIAGVRKEGSFVYSAVDPSDENDFKKAFSWTVSSSDNNLTEYVQTVEASDIGAVETGYAVYEFFLIPHTFPTNVKEGMKITFDVEGSDGQIHQISTLANNLGTNSWDAGYRYNYYVNEESARLVDVDVSETFDGSVKTNVGVENIKRSTAYVRAYIVANWATPAGKILSTFDDSGIDYNDESGMWAKGSDGYWYYKKPLVGFATTSEPLVKSFDESKATSPVFQIGSYHMIWNIVAQGVEYDEAKTYVVEAWPGVSVNGGTSLSDWLEVE